jgi:hypothetical protein
LPLGFPVFAKLVQYVVIADDSDSSAGVGT